MDKVQRETNGDYVRNHAMAGAGTPFRQRPPMTIQLGKATNTQRQHLTDGHQQLRDTIQQITRTTATWLSVMFPAIPTATAMTNTMTTTLRMTATATTTRLLSRKSAAHPLFETRLLDLKVMT
jgi:hypothetical protein